MHAFSKALVFAAGLVAIVGAAQASGPSFNCQGSLADVERTICSSERLSALDRRMSGLYASVSNRIRPRSDVPFLVADQKRWLAKRDGCWTRFCIAGVYRQRIDTLSEYAVLRDD
jgi:uncharacterized protein